MMHPKSTSEPSGNYQRINGNRRLGWNLLAAICALLAASCCCSCNQGQDDTLPPQQDTPTMAAHEHAGYNFTPEQTSNIIDNLMHEAHVDDAAIECKSCHQDREQFLSHASALALCLDCHDGQIVALEVWENHCLSCHQFTKFKEQYAESTHALRELCQDCHGEGSVFFRAFDPESPHDITCDNCHQPHRSALVIAVGICDECHEEITDKISADNNVHGSCIVCHTPHSELPDADELCGRCHVATSNILVHNVPEHPSSCLACHSAHFTETEITSGSCLVCHDDTYYGGRSNLPYAHRNCQNCHYAKSFAYMGDDQCAKCHEPEGEVIARAVLPVEHRECATCHKPHSWHAEFEHSCDGCHDVEAVIEHRLSFHQATCAACHDPHHTELMAKSGHCDGCHGEGTFPNFRADLIDAHLQCTNCHSQVAVDSRDFKFVGHEESCLICHSQASVTDQLGWEDVPNGHQLCEACHEAHTFDTVPTGMHCDMCHRAVYEEFPSQAHSECFNCHQAGHAAEYSGQEASCDICHADVLAKATVKTKADCILCHAQHDFEADAEACAVCHTDIMEQAMVEEHANCVLCHGDHNWRPDAATCSICHPEPPGLHQVDMSVGCLDCHVSHSMTAGLSTCVICHTELSEHCTSSGCTDCHAFRAAD